MWNLEQKRSKILLNRIFRYGFSDHEKKFIVHDYVSDLSEDTKYRVSLCILCSSRTKLDYMQQIRYRLNWRFLFQPKLNNKMH